MRKIIILAIFSLVLFSVGVLTAKTSTDGKDAPGVGAKAPLFALDSIMYDRFIMMDKLEEVKKEKGIIILDFWATWCAPCKKEMPIFQKINEELTENNVHLYAISHASRCSEFREEISADDGYDCG